MCIQTEPLTPGVCASQEASPGAGALGAGGAGEAELSRVATCDNE